MGCLRHHPDRRVKERREIDFLRRLFERVPRGISLGIYEPDNSALNYKKDKHEESRRKRRANNLRVKSLKNNFLSREGYLELSGEFDGQKYEEIYHVDKNSLETQRDIVRWMDEGKIRRGIVNRMKYRGRETEI